MCVDGCAALVMQIQFKHDRHVGDYAESTASGLTDFPLTIVRMCICNNIKSFITLMKKPAVGVTRNERE